MANKVVQLIDKDDNNIFPVAGSIAGDSITTGMIKDDAITTAKIDDGAVTANKIDSSTIFEIVGTTSNYAIKYNDGRLICCQRMTVSTDTGAPWGDLYGYQVGASPNYAVSFISNPVVSVDWETDGFNCWIVSYNNDATTTHYQTMQLVRPVALNVGETITGIINILAVGRWKA